MEMMIKIVGIAIPVYFGVLISIEIYKYNKFLDKYYKSKKRFEELKKKMEK